MKIFEYRTDPDAFRYLDITEELFEATDAFQRGPLSSKWRPWRVDIKGEPKPMPDLFQVDHRIPVFTQKALECLRPRLASHIEILELECPNAELFAVNIYRRCDSLIPAESDFRANRFGNIIEVNQGAFDHARVSDQGMFVIPRHGSVFMTEPLYDTIQAIHLSGLRDTEVGCSNCP